MKAGWRKGTLDSSDAVPLRTSLKQEKRQKSHTVSPSCLDLDHTLSESGVFSYTVDRLSSSEISRKVKIVREIA